MTFPRLDTAITDPEIYENDENEKEKVESGQELCAAPDQTRPGPEQALPYLYLPDPTQARPDPTRHPPSITGILCGSFPVPNWI